VRITHKRCLGGQIPVASSRYLKNTFFGLRLPIPVQTVQTVQTVGAIHFKQSNPTL
jgi:hypothetical protein